MHRIKAIDGLRAVAVACVMAAHLLPVFGIEAWDLGRAGVYIFFVISGYVITLTLIADGIDLQRFYIRRAFRILPAMWLYLASIYILGMTIDVFPAAVFLCNMAFGQCEWVVSHTWTLAFEEQFYLLYPSVLAALLLRRRPSWIIILAFLFAALPFFYPVYWIGRTGFVKVYAFLGLGALLAMRPMRPPRIAKQLLELQPLPYVGRISYSLYLWQQAATSDAVPLKWRPVGMAIAVIIAMISFHTFESYFMRVGRGLAQRYGANNLRTSEDRALSGLEERESK